MLQPQEATAKASVRAATVQLLRAKLNLCRIPLPTIGKVARRAVEVDEVADAGRMPMVEMSLR